MADQAGSTGVFLTGVSKNLLDFPKFNPSQLSPVLLGGARFLPFLFFFRNRNFELVIVIF